MFKNMIPVTPLTDEFANDFFSGKIEGDPYNGDTSLVATLRALVYPRMKNDDRLYVLHRNLREGFDSTSGNVLRSISVGSGDEWSNHLIIVNVCHVVEEERKKWFDWFPENFVKKYPGWVRIEKVTNLFNRVFRVDCYVNEEARESIVFADMMDMRKFHYLQCGALGFVPWYFDKEKGVTDLEMELHKALREKTSTQYEECIVKIATQYNLMEKRLRKLLDGFELRYERRALSETNNKIEEQISRLNDLNARISQCLEDKHNLEIRALGLEKKIADGNGESEILDLFLSNQNLILRQVDDSAMTFVVREELAFFDEETAKMLIGNERGYLYNPETDGSRYIPKEDMKRFATAVFVDQTVKIRFCAAYRFDMNGGCQAISGYEYPPECDTYLPNPHIHHYHCLGAYSRYINELLAKHDYAGAICQCIASAKSLNLSEGPTMIKFMRSLYGIGSSTSAKKFVMLPDGTLATVKEACEWLKNNEDKGGES